MHKIDLNCDLGESFGIYNFGKDEILLDYISSVNIACGFHAGDPLVIEKTVDLAIQKGVSIGAHPGYQDVLGFGRREIKMTLEEIRASIIYQVGALKTFVEVRGGRLNHVKPHGALYNLAASDAKVAETIAKAVFDIDDTLILLGLANSELIRAGKKVGLKVANEVFADRRYTRDLKLVNRAIEGSVINNVDDSIQQCIDIIVNGNVMDIEMKRREIIGDSICIHGDQMHSVDLAKYLVEVLKLNEIKVERLK